MFLIHITQHIVNTIRTLVHIRWNKVGGLHSEKSHLLKRRNPSGISISGQINLQSLEDTQVGYISHSYTLDEFTLEKYALEKLTFSYKYTLRKYTPSAKVLYPCLSL